MQTKNVTVSNIKRNQAYHTGVINRLANAKKLKRSISFREKYFQRLGKNPLFKRILANRKRILIIVKGKAREYQLCTIGREDVNLVLRKEGERKDERRAMDEELDDMIEAKITFILDPLKRVRFFYKPTEEYARNAPWQEIRPITVIEDDGVQMIYTKKRVIKANEKVEAMQLSMSLQMNERNISFPKDKEKILIKDIMQIQELM